METCTDIFLPNVLEGEQRPWQTRAACGAGILWAAGAACWASPTVLSRQVRDGVVEESLTDGATLEEPTKLLRIVHQKTEGSDVEGLLRTDMHDWDALPACDRETIHTVEAPETKPDTRPRNDIERSPKGDDR